MRYFLVVNCPACTAENTQHRPYRSVANVVFAAIKLDRKCTQQQATGVHRDVLMFLPRGTPDNRQPAKVRCEGVRSPARPRTQPPIHNNGAGCTIFVLMNSSLSCLLEGQYKGVHILARHRSAYWRRCSDTSSLGSGWQCLAQNSTLAQYARPAWRGKQQSKCYDPTLALCSL